MTYHAAIVTLNWGNLKKIFFRVAAWYFVDYTSFHNFNSIIGLRAVKQIKFKVGEHRKNITQHHQPSLIYQPYAPEHHAMNWNKSFHFEQTPKFIFTQISRGLPYTSHPSKFQQIHHITHNINNNYTQ